ncbi:MAG: acyl-CoA dehydrogenase family protein [Deltaproteobacteria bacterium]|nr:acyl-CoA dehydrogenase family protein [Deltaproteobacteria bacterium]
MDLSFGAEYEAFRDEVKLFVSEAWPRGADAVCDRAVQLAFVVAAVERGYLYRSIPKKYGGSEQEFDSLRESIIVEEFDRAAVPWRLGNQGVGQLVPTLLEVGDEWQRERFIRPTLRGEYVWCQGYSEPGAGSDLAALRSSARLEGDEWVINGHKIWTSDAEDANFMFGMFRTEREASKHAGISYLLLEMDQPGVDVRPLRQINGATHFHEVFFDDARTPADWVVGGRGQGWRVARVNLKHERNLGSGQAMRRRFHQLLDLAQSARIDGRPASRDPVMRERLAELECLVRCVETTSLRQLSAVAHGEEADIGLPLLVAKLYGSEVMDRIAGLAYDLIGADGLLAPTDSGWADLQSGAGEIDWVDQYLFVLAMRIAGGSSNIQRNLIGERGLGLPRDLRATDVAR